MTAATHSPAPSPGRSPAPASPSPAETAEVCRAIEAGLLARELLLTGGRFADASEIELRLLAEHGEAARARFVEANLGLVGLVAGRYARRTGLADGELFQEGCLGLLAAVVRFDHTRGVRFSTYALFWIRAHVLAATSRQLGRGVPQWLAAERSAMRAAEAQLAQRLGRAPTLAELSSAHGRSVQRTVRLLGRRAPGSPAAAGAPEPACETSRLALEAVLCPPAPVRGLLDRLDPPARRVLRLRLGFEGEVRTLAETARELGVPVSRVRRIEARALDELRGHCPASWRDAA